VTLDDLRARWPGAAFQRQNERANVPGLLIIWGSFMRIRVTKSNPTPAGVFNSAVSGLRFPSWQIALLLALVTVVLYWPAMRCDFINYDDPDYVTANFHVLGGLSWENVKWAFSNTEQAAYWAPLMWLSHMLACQIFGLNPWGHHLLNVLLHAANTALAFLVFQRMTGAT
jgi:hypothetical protein